MKKLSIVSLFVCCFLLLSAQWGEAQVIRRTNAQTATGSALSYGNFSGAVERTIVIKKADIPGTTNINQLASIVKQGLKAFEFIPQNNGLLSDQYIHVSKVKPLNGAVSVSVKSSGSNFILAYSIQKLPLMGCHSEFKGK